MRTIFRGLLTLGLLLFFSGLHAQISEEESSLIQDLWGMEKKELIAQYMELNPGTEQSFWSLYDRYESERKELGMNRFDIINEYGMNYASLDDDMARSLTLRWFKNNIKIEKLQRKYYKKMSRTIGGLEASKFMQAEKYMESIIRLNIQDQIPFIGEVNPKSM